ncbi:tetraspanin-1-like [Styela clava]
MGEKAVKVSKYLLIAFNCLFLLAGLGLLGGGIWIVTAFSSFNDTFSQFLDVESLMYDWIGYVAIGFGAFVALVAFLGCCGAICENKCMLGSFFVIILIFALVEIALAILVFVYAGNLKSILESPVKNVIQNTYLHGTAVGNSYDNIQKEHHCCGFSGGSDYANSVYANTHNRVNPWPPSCCTDENDTSPCTDINPPTKSNSDKGCFEPISEILIGYSGLIGGVAIGLAAIKILSMVFTCCVYCGIGGHSAKVGPFGGRP